MIENQDETSLYEDISEEQANIICFDDILKLGKNKKDQKLSIKDMVKELNQDKTSIKSSGIKFENEKRKLQGKYHNIFDEKQKKIKSNQQQIEINFKEYQTEELHQQATPNFANIFNDNQRQYVNSNSNSSKQNYNQPNNVQNQPIQNCQQAIIDNNPLMSQKSKVNMKEIMNIINQQSSSDSEEDKIYLSRLQKNVKQKDQIENKNKINIKKKRKIQIKFSGQVNKTNDEMQIYEAINDQNYQQNIEDNSKPPDQFKQELQQDKKKISEQHSQNLNFNENQQQQQQQSYQDIRNTQIKLQNEDTIIGSKNEQQMINYQEIQDSINIQNPITNSENSPQKIAQNSKIIQNNNSRSLKDKNIIHVESQDIQQNQQTDLQEIQQASQEVLCTQVCPICYDIPKNIHKSSICNHTACYDCWKKWLGEQLTCPMCRVRCRLAYLESCI